MTSTTPTFTPLSHLPTPLDDAPRLSEAVGARTGARILVKRDDLTGLALGGNKARKLDYLLRDAIERGCDTLVTAGGAQSNFARMTAATNRIASPAISCSTNYSARTCTSPARPTGLSSKPK